MQWNLQVVAKLANVQMMQSGRFEKRLDFIIIRITCDNASAPGAQDAIDTCLQYVQMVNKDYREYRA